MTIATGTATASITEATITPATGMTIGAGRHNYHGTRAVWQIREASMILAGHSTPADDTIQEARLIREADTIRALPLVEAVQRKRDLGGGL